jgi:aspartyl-tRNA(Asn)/glutamyl-tRNA(Gln) amidotransferase subunit A
MSSDEESFIDWATRSDLARWAFRAGLFGVRVGAAFAPKMPSSLVTAVTERFPELVAMGALTIISNVYGNPAVSIPIEPIGGLPVGLQVLAARHRDALLFDVALAVERERPWPMVAPVSSSEDVDTARV